MAMADSPCGIQAFSTEFLDDLSARAAASPRLRQHHNIHSDYDDPCQRFLNAIEPGSYLRPHRHCLIPRAKLLMAVRGRFALVLFDDVGAVTQVQPFGLGQGSPAAGVDVAAGYWNTVLSLAPGSILLEAKAGPFDPQAPREPAPWAPEEGGVEAVSYLERLRAQI